MFLSIPFQNAAASNRRHREVLNSDLALQTVKIMDSRRDYRKCVSDLNLFPTRPQPVDKGFEYELSRQVGSRPASGRDQA